MQEALREVWNVVDAIAQRGDVQVNDVEPVEQVLAKRPGATASSRSTLVAATTRTSARTVRWSPTGAYSWSLEHAQQLHLQGGRELADLVEKQRAAFGVGEATGLVA